MRQPVRGIERLESRQLFALAPGDPVLVSMTDTALATNPAMAMAPDGSYVVAWDTSGVNGVDHASVYARRFNAAGSPIGDAFLVSPENPADQLAPDVAINGSGDFVITWERGELEDADIYARAYEADATPATDSILVTTRTDGGQIMSTVGISDAGNFTIAWTTEIRNQFGNEISHPLALRRFANDGTALSNELVLHEPEDPQAWQFEFAGDPQIAMSSSGAMVLTWAFGSVHAQRFDADGALVGDEIQVAMFGPDGVHFVPRDGSTAVDLRNDGQFAVAWKEGQSLAYFQQFDPDGIPLHEAKLLPDVSQGDFDFVATLAVSYDTAGNLQVMDDADWFVVQAYDRNGLPTGEQTVSGPSGEVVRFAPSPLGGFTVVYGVPADGIFSQTYAADTTAPMIISPEYQFDASRRVHVEFSEPVSVSGYAELRVAGATTGISSIWASSEPGFVTSADFDIPSFVGDGNYRLIIPDGIAHDRAGLASASQSFDFFIFAGDANHDRRIDVADFKVFSANWMQTNRTFSQGDFNYDGNVDQADLAILSAKWDTSLAPYVEPVPIQSPTPAPSSSSSRRTRSVAASVLT